MAKNKIYTFLVAITVTFSGIGMSATAQDKSEQVKTNLYSKSPEEQASEFKKHGWSVSSRAQTMERQLFRAKLMENDKNENGEPKYVIGRGRGIESVYDAAKRLALESAKQNIVTKVQSAIASQIQSAIDNQQLSQDEGEIVLQVVQGCKGGIEQSIGRLITIVEMSRNTRRGIEVIVTTAYNYDIIKEKVKTLIYNTLKQQGTNLSNKIEDCF